MSSNYALPPRPRTPSPASNTQKDLLIKVCNSAFKASRKFKISKPRKLATSKGDDFLTPLQFFFFNIMFLNKVSGYSRAAAQGRSLGRASTWDLINQINNEASKGKQRTRYRPSCLFVFPLRHCSYKQWAHSKGFKNIPGEVSISTTQSPSPFSQPANTSLQKAILPVLETGNLWSVVPGMKKEDEYPDSNNLGMLLVAKGERKLKAHKDPICSQVRLSLA